MVTTDQHQKIFDSLQIKIKTLHDSIWERRADWPLVERWLGQFAEDADVNADEQVQALFLLSNFMYFGTSEVRALLRSLFRDSFRPRLAQHVRGLLSGANDPAVLSPAIDAELAKTRFVALGNPAESSAMLLYYFRQENRLHKDLFINASEVFHLSATGTSVQADLKDQGIEHYVFIDDLCGSGDQGLEYSTATVEPIKAMKPEAKTYYYSLFGLSEGLARIRDEGKFDVVCSIVELDRSFKAFAPTSRIFAKAEPPFERTFSEKICSAHGAVLCPGDPLGYQDGQLLIGFSHNTPDNTLPIFWSDGEIRAPWIPVFKRYPKVYWP